ncbi:hypothetical protein A1Q1_04205 [Trichosporon asahii var. asahii CBS 2479]|uniref:Uncharacterized protein n=1 Tax=Trichosporon asahii var. asahii (strain ATCC 90039 / CBS 2479 / JCM 2466 / KCTC 7840 / NBRC 103889/ NCYC 2677 / UAMH 7654) TaxID=1186058 RepID=J6EVX5_TRIAS|nr:hypothetical protein A1Q1_04205 [Trichosporon asahii var. asahii CBS 2479]EJT46962.1 hypothetical protein A1Q1_04205 [Trichosporon asahii var. asahii CBS 2479]
MAAPATKTIANISGSWGMSLSDSTDAVLALQGIGWVTRKTIGAAGLTLAMKQYTAKDTDGEHDLVYFPNTPGKEPDSAWLASGPSSEESVVIHFDQIITGGLKGTSETRFVNGLLHDHTDWLFGTVSTQNVFREYAEIVALDDLHLAGRGKQGPWIDDGTPMLITQARSPNGWVAIQTWGFQNIAVNGTTERRFARNIVVTKGKDRVEIRLVYDFLGELAA